MFSNYPLDNLSLYSALAGTSIGVVLSLGGLVVSNSKGLWGMLGFIEGAIYFSRRSELDENPELNLSETFPKTLILHAVWFVGSLICSIVLYSIWNGQDMFEDKGKSFGFENGILFAELVLAVLPQLVAIGLYFYDRHQRGDIEDGDGSNKKKRRHRKNKKGKDKKSKKSKSSYSEDDPYGDSAGAAAGGAGGSEGLSDDGLGGTGGEGAGGGTGGLSDEDLEKQPLKEDDYHSEDDEFGDVGGTDSKKKSKDKDEYGDDGFGEEGDHASDEDSEYRNSSKGKDGGNGDHLDDQDQARQGGRGSESSEYQRSGTDGSSRPSSSYSRQPNMIHVESHTRDPRTGREVVSQQEWNSSQGRYEPPQMPPLPPPPRYMTSSPTYYYSAPPTIPTYPPSQSPQAQLPTRPPLINPKQSLTLLLERPTLLRSHQPRPASPPYPYPYGQSPYAYPSKSLRLSVKVPTPINGVEA
ncbi:hypothetical protein JCM16303_003978 [Sporobolomyces ruberrimus]